jgi:hypothetical protein
MHTSSSEEDSLSAGRSAPPVFFGDFLDFFTGRLGEDLTGEEAPAERLVAGEERTRFEGDDFTGDSFAIIVLRVGG